MESHIYTLNDTSHVGGVLTIKTFKNGELVRTIGPLHNKIVSSEGYGRNLILRALKGEIIYPIAFTDACLGDSSTAPADGDTDLGNVLLDDIPITDMVVANDVLTVDVFIADANLPDGTYREFGLKASGRLIPHILISPDYSKSTGEDTLFTYTLTMTG